MIRLNTDKSAAVNQSLTWLSIDDHPPPVGVKPDDFQIVDYKHQQHIKLPVAV